MDVVILSAARRLIAAARQLPQHAALLGDAASRGWERELLDAADALEARLAGIVQAERTQQADTLQPGRAASADDSRRHG